MKYIVTINNNNYEVEVERGEATVRKTGENAAPIVVTQTVPIETPKTVEPAPKPTVVSRQTAEGDPLCAPMPGLILQIKKNAGDSVKKGDVIFILEAMKMENEIFAPKDGVIGQILTSNGASVSTGDVLAIFKS